MSDAEETCGRHDEHNVRSARIPIVRGSGRRRNQKKKKVDVAALAKRATKKNGDDESGTMAAESAGEEDLGEDKVAADSAEEHDSEWKVGSKTCCRTSSKIKRTTQKNQTKVQENRTAKRTRGSVCRKGTEEEKEATE